MTLWSTSSRWIGRIGGRVLRAPAEASAFEVLVEDLAQEHRPELPKLNIGSGSLPLDGWINVDRTVVADCSAVIDANDGLPFAAGQFGVVLAKDVIEHVDHVALLREVHRVLAPGGLAVLSTPHYTSRFLWIDPTHRRGFSVRSFDYFAADFDNPNDFYFDFAFEELDPPWLTFGVPKRNRYHRWLERWVNADRSRSDRYEASILCRLVPAVDLWIVMRR